MVGIRNVTISLICQKRDRIKIFLLLSYFINVLSIVLYSFPRADVTSTTNIVATEVFSLTIEEARSVKSRWQQGWFLLETNEETVPCLSPCFWCCWKALVFLGWQLRSLQSLSLLSHDLLPWVGLCIVSSHKDNELIAPL